MADFKVVLNYKVNWDKPNGDGVIFPIDSKLDDVAKGLAEKHGSLGGGSGSGMGFRDLDFEFDDIEKAKAFEENLKEYPRFLDVSVHEITCLEDMLTEVRYLLPKAGMTAQVSVLGPYIESHFDGSARAVKTYTENEFLWDFIKTDVIDSYLESTDEGIRNGACDRVGLLEDLNDLRSSNVKDNQN